MKAMFQIREAVSPKGGESSGVAIRPRRATGKRPPEKIHAIDRWKEWDQFLEGTAEAGFMQASWWADFRISADYENFGAVVRSSGQILGGAVVLKYFFEAGTCFYYIPEGPVLPPNAVFAAEVYEAILRDIGERRKAEKETVSHLRIEPRWTHLPRFLAGFHPVPFKDRFTEPRDTLCIDLRQPEEEILAQMKPKGRYNIRVALRHGVSIVEDPSEQGVLDFLKIYEEMTARQGIPAKPPDYFQELISILSSNGKGSLFFAEQDGERLASAIVVCFGPRATYFFGGSLGKKRNVMAPYLLHYEIIRRAKAMGYQWYDLWGVAPENVPDHPWRDISVFKRKLGGEEVTLVPTLDFVYDPAAYDRYLASVDTKKRRNAQSVKRAAKEESES